MRPADHVAVVLIVAVFAIAGSILVWSNAYHDLGQALVGVAVLIGVVRPAVLRARRRQS